MGGMLRLQKYAIPHQTFSFSLVCVSHDSVGYNPLFSSVSVIAVAAQMVSDLAGGCPVKLASVSSRVRPPLLLSERDVQAPVRLPWHRPPVQRSLVLSSGR